MQTFPRVVGAHESRLFANRKCTIKADRLLTTTYRALHLGRGALDRAGAD